MSKLGFIGLGIMGAPMVAHRIKAGRGLELMADHELAKAAA